MAKNEAKIRFSAETEDFNSEIKKTNESMSQLRAEMKLNETQMKATGATVEGLEKKHEILTKQLKVSEDKTQALSKKVDKAAEIFGENSSEVAKLRTQLLNAQTAEERIRQAVNACNDELEEQRRAANETEEAHESLSDTIEKQQSELDDLKKKYVEVVTQQGKSSREAKELAKEIDKLSGELKDNQYAMNRAEKAADDLDNTIDDLADSAKDAGEGFTVFKGMLADLASSGVQAAISGIGNLVSSFLELSESTKETRVAFSKLEASFGSAGLDADYAYDTIYDLYGVLGDTDKATEASNFLAKICDTEQELDEYTRILTGTFALYGDSIPTEGLAEGIAASAEMGSVQGVLADALEWQGVNLDKFNKNLENMNSSEERSAYIKKWLSSLYGKAADDYRANNENLIEANESQLRYNQALAELGEKSEPITTGLRDGFANLLSEVNALADDVDFEAIGASIEGAFKWFGQEMLPKIVEGTKSFVEGLKEAKQWVEEHSGLMIALATGIGIVAVAVGAYNVVQGIQTAMAAAQVTTVWALVAAQAAQLASTIALYAPYIAITALIAGIIAVVVLLIKNWDKVVEVVKNCWKACKATLAKWGSWINTNVVKPVLNYFSDLWKSASETFSKLWNGFKDGARDAWEGTKSIFSKVGEFFSNTFKIVKDKIVSVFQAGGEVFNNIKDGIVNVFKTVVNGLIRGINKVITVPFKGLNKILDKIYNLKIAGMRPFTWLTWRAPIPEIPLLAKGGILTKPTLNIAGEAGPEAIIPIDKLNSFLSSSIQKTTNVVNMNALAKAIEDLASRPINLNVNGRQIAVATAGDSDSVNGLRSTFKGRGLVLD